MDLEKIAEKYPHAEVTRCADRGCRLKVSSGHRFLILKGDSLDPNNKMCDCLMFRKDGNILIAELKHRVQHVDAVLEKFNRSVAVSLSIASESGSKKNSVTLVLVSGPYRRPFEHDQILSRPIKHAGISYRIKIGRCGAQTSNFMK